MNKSAVLTEDEYKAYTIYSEVLRYIHEYQVFNNLQPFEINVLDLGCARGEMVLRLREMGYNAYGVDVIPDYLENSRQIFSDKGLDHSKLLRVVGTDGGNDFADGFFDIVVSVQVLEHVEKIERVAVEIFRLLKPGGISFHWLPPKWGFVEPHYSIPCVHWLPKNALRKIMIFPFVLFGCYAGNWKEAYSGKNSSQITDAIYQYSLKETYYRTRSSLIDKFGAAGLRAKFVTMDNPRLQQLGLLCRLLKCRAIHASVEMLLTNFIHTEFMANKQG